MNVSGKLGIIGIAAAVVSLGYTAYIQSTMNKANNAINESVNRLAEGTSVDVSQEIIDAAVKKAVAREVGRAIAAASFEAVDGVRQDIRREVKSAVDLAYASIRTSVSDEVTRQVANLNIEKLKADVQEKAKQEVLEKFDANLEGIIEDFKQNLANISKIYGAIATAQTPTDTIRIKLS